MDLARLLQGQGDLAAARHLYERALAIREKAFGTEHPDTASNLEALGHLVMDQGDLTKAGLLFKSALAIREKTLGHDDPDTVRSLSNLAYLLEAQGNVADAWQLHERALAIRQKMLGPEHSDTVDSLLVLAMRPAMAEDFREHGPSMSVRSRSHSRCSVQRLQRLQSRTLQSVPHTTFCWRTNRSGGVECGRPCRTRQRSWT